MIRRHLPLLVLLATTAAGPALAACTDPPAPGVVWRRCLLDGRDFSRANFTGAHLRDVSLARTRLVGTNFTEVDAFSARFVSSNLTGANFTEANLRDVDFTRAVLRDATLVRADLRGAKLFRANLSGADLTGADLTGADLSNTVLDGARWTDGERICGEGSVGFCQ